MKIWHKISLQARLSLLYATLLFLSIGIVGIYSYWNVWKLLIYNKTSHIRARAKPIIEHWLQKEGLTSNSTICPIDSFNVAQLARDLTSRETNALILNQRGEIIANGKYLPEEPDAPQPIPLYVQKALAGNNEVNYRSEIDGKPFIVLLIPIRPHPKSPQIIGAIQLSTPLTNITKILLQQGLILTAVVIITFILGGIIGFYLISSSLRDLHKLSKACRRIATGDFRQIVHIPTHRDEIGHLTESFNQMVEKLQATFSSQQRFAANAAHELLTPLTGIKGSLEVLLRGVQDDPASTARLCRCMHNEVTRLIRLCENLLGLTRLENATNLRKQLIQIESFFEEFLPQAQLLYNNHLIQLKKGPATCLVADKDILKQILLNLLSNAVKHSPPNSTITTEWRISSTQIEIRVSDQGEGIAPEILPHVFEPFFKGKSNLGNNNKGAGLGLTLTKAMVEAHGGHISIHSEKGKGTTVIFTLPLE